MNTASQYVRISKCVATIISSLLLIPFFTHAEGAPSVTVTEGSLHSAQVVKGEPVYATVTWKSENLTLPTRSSFCTDAGCPAPVTAMFAVMNETGEVCAGPVGTTLFEEDTTFVTAAEGLMDCATTTAHVGFLDSSNTLMKEVLLPVSQPEQVEESTKSGVVPSMDAETIDYTPYLYTILIASFVALFAVVGLFIFMRGKKSNDVTL